MQQICLITCYMGPLPDYFGYYVATCRQNSSIRFVVINDTLAESRVEGNIEYWRMNLAELNAWASSALGTEVKLQSAWKINELKPLFGRLFRDKLSGFDFWGWCDLDIIWGDLRHFLNDRFLEEYDVVTSKAMWTAGHFTLLRNQPLCNDLFARNPRIIELLNEKTYYAFEECSHRWDGIPRTPDAFGPGEGYPSMYDIVRQAEASGEIRAHFKDIIREHPQPVNYLYRDGKLFDLGNGEEFMYYHLITVKKIWRFYIAPYTACKQIVMTPYGIQPDSQNAALWWVRRAFSCLKGIRASAAKQSPSALLKKLVKRRSD